MQRHSSKLGQGFSCLVDSFAIDTKIIMCRQAIQRGNVSSSQIHTVMVDQRDFRQWERNFTIMFTSDLNQESRSNCVMTSLLTPCRQAAVNGKLQGVEVWGLRIRDKEPLQESNDERAVVQESWIMRIKNYGSTKPTIQKKASKGGWDPCVRTYQDSGVEFSRDTWEGDSGP